MTDTSDEFIPGADDEERPPVDLRTDIPHSARIYDYVIGGKDNFPADRAAAEQMLTAWPNLRISMRQSRAFMHRIAAHLAKEEGIRQFLDIGTGIPTSPNLHEIVQAVAPESRIVYVDNDPIVLVHARALMTSTEAGRTAYIDADMRDPEKILEAPQLRETLDLDQPVALSVIAVLQFVPDEFAYDIVQRLLEPLPSGSFLALSTVTTDSAPAGTKDVAEEYKARGIFVQPRTHAQVERFFDGLEMVEPGVVLVHRWRPDDYAATARDSEVGMYGAVARKP